MIEEDVDGERERLRKRKM
jgi:RNA-binding motif X-linked protein 2